MFGWNPFGELKQVQERMGRIFEDMEIGFTNPLHICDWGLQ